MKLKFSKSQLQNYIIFLAKISVCADQAILKFSLENNSITTSSHDTNKTWIRLISMKETADNPLFEVVDNPENITNFLVCIYNIKNYIDTIRILQSFENSDSITIEFHGYENWKEIAVNELQTEKNDKLKDLVTKISDFETLYTNSTKIIFKHADIDLISMVIPYVNQEVINKYNSIVEDNNLKYSLNINNISSICNLLKKQMMNCIESAFISIIVDETKDKLIFKTSDSVVEYSIPLDDIVDLKNSDGNTIYNFSFKPAKHVLSAIDSAKTIKMKFSNNIFINFEENINCIRVQDFVGSAKN